MTRSLTLLVLTVSFGAAGCGGIGGRETGPDAGMTRADSGGIPDASGAGGDASGPPLTDGGAGIDGPEAGSPMFSESESDPAAATRGDFATGAGLYVCYDGIDNPPANGKIDCQDDGCAGLASCCAGPDFDCCDTPRDVTLPTLCDGPLDVCMTPGFHAFGSPSSYTTLGAIFPNGDHADDSGVIFDDPLDNARASYVHARMTIPPDGSCTTGRTCIESVAIGVTTDTTYAATSTVRPMAALVGSANLHAVLVMSGEAVLGTVPVDNTSGPATFDVELRVSAAGLVEADVAGVQQFSEKLPAPGAPLHVVVWGHNENMTGATAANSAHVEMLSVTQAACDVPSVWRTRGPVSVGGGATAVPNDLSGPSVAYTPTDAYLAFASRGAIFVAHRMLGGSTSSYALQAGYDTPSIGALGGTFADPDIHHLADGTWRLWLVNRATDAIMVSDGTEATSLTWDPPRSMMLSASDDVLHSVGVVHVDGPSVLPPSTTRPSYTMAVRATMMDGTTRVLLLTSDDGVTNWQLLYADLDRSTVNIPRGYTDVAHDEVASPSLIYRNGGYQLFYAGRTFGRWATSVVLSDTLEFWRPSPSPVVLQGAGGAAFDAFSVSDPGVSTVDTDDTRLEMFYAASNGSATSIGRVERPVTVAWAGAHGVMP